MLKKVAWHAVSCLRASFQLITFPGVLNTEYEARSEVRRKNTSQASLALGWGCWGGQDIAIPARLHLLPGIPYYPPTSLHFME